MNLVELKSGSLDLYKTWKIPKIKDGKLQGWRIIEEPCEELKKIQQNALTTFEKFPFPPYIYGIKNTSAVQNAAQHQGKKIIIKLDIKDFFPNTTQALLRKEVFKYRDDVNGDYTKMIELLDYCFIKDGTISRLPQGAPTSPILSSIAFSSMDQQLQALAALHGLIYTRYVDDLTFSGSYRPKDFVHQVSMIVAPHYRINWKKVESLHQGYQRQEVTGVVINQKLSIPRTIRHNLRAQLDRLAHEGKELDEETKGLLSYISSVSKDQHDSLIHQYGRRKQFYRDQALKTGSCSEQSISPNSTNNS